VEIGYAVLGEKTDEVEALDSELAGRWWEDGTE
jgi:hypothetical protein